MACTVRVRSLIAQPSPLQDHCSHNSQDVPINKMNAFESSTAVGLGNTYHNL